MSRNELQALCVWKGCDTHRYDLFLCLNEILQLLKRHSIPCEVWVDGSFATEKSTPNDIDASIMIESSAFDALSAEAKAEVVELANLEGKYKGLIDLFVCIIFPKGTVERDLDPPEGYSSLWGMEHSERYIKGFIVLEMPHAVL